MLHQHRLQKMCQREIIKKREEEEWDRWFDRTRPMTTVKCTWREKQMAREENSEEESDNSIRSREDIGNETGHVDESGNQESKTMEVNMVFTIPTEFHALKHCIAELSLGVEKALFEKPEKNGEHMKPLFIRGHLDGAPMGRIVVDGGISINIMPLTIFKRLGHVENDLKQTNLGISGFSGEPAEARGIVCKELTVGSTVPIAFFIVDVIGRYNVLLECDWIHANGCIPSTLHQCVIQWVGDEVEVIGATMTYVW
jgi:hypothetical protein